MDAQAAFDSLMAVAAEAVTEEELRALCERAAEAAALRPAASGGLPAPSEPARAPKAYIGFEPSGTAHIGWMVCTDTVRRLTAAGFDVTLFLADWHAQINGKLGGDLAAIQRCGRYMEEAFEALGVPRDAVRYVYANEFVKDPAYWALVIQVMGHTTLARMRRAMTILGRKEDEGDADMAKFLYPAMQVADIFHMGIDLAYGGLDQRHAHMLARDVARQLGRTPPVGFHTPLVPSLKAGAGRMNPAEVEQRAAATLAKESGSSSLHPRPPGGAVPDITVAGADGARFSVELKMSKSDPDSGIFIHDSPEDIARKLKGAHCPAKEVEGNPVLDLARLVVWPRLGQLGGSFAIQRPERFGGNQAYTDFAALQADFAAGALHPMDLKNGVATALAKLLEPVRAYFEKHPDNWRFVQELRRTR